MATIATEIDSFVSPVAPAIANTELQAVLAAWNDATIRLQETHIVLREEVRRLTDELEKKNRQLAQKNRLADLGQMASHVAHEVRNNLVPISLYISLLRRKMANVPQCLKYVEKIDAGITAQEVTVNDLLQFTADREPKRQLILLKELVSEVMDSVFPQLQAQAICATLDIDPAQSVVADRNMLRRVVLNLVLNSIDVMPEGGEIVVTAIESPGHLELEIADSGPGLSDVALSRAFEPFFTTKSGGTGLGLAIVQRIAQVHGGNAYVANCPEGGAAFTIQIPKQAMEAAA